MPHGRLRRTPTVGRPITDHCHLLATRTWWRLFWLLTLRSQPLKMGGGNFAAQSAETQRARVGANTKRPFKSSSCGGTLGGHCPLFRHLLLGVPRFATLDAPFSPKNVRVFCLSPLLIEDLGRMPMANRPRFLVPLLFCCGCVRCLLHHRRDVWRAT